MWGAEALLVPHCKCPLLSSGPLSKLQEKSHLCSGACFVSLGHSPGPILPVDTHRHFLHCSQCCGWTSPCGSSWDYKTHLSKNHQKTLKNQVYYSLLPLFEVVLSMDSVIWGQSQSEITKWKIPEANHSC